MGLILDVFGQDDPFNLSPPGIAGGKVGLLPSSSELLKMSSLELALLEEPSAGTRGNINTGSSGLFGGFGDFVTDSFQQIAGAGVSRLQSELLGFTRDSVDSLERDSYGSLPNQDQAKLQRQQARALAKRQDATKRNFLLVGGAAVVLIAGSMFFRK